MQHQIVQHLKGTTLNSGASLIMEELFWQLNVVAVAVYITT